MFPPDGLLTSEQTKHDVELHTHPHIIAPDPFASDDCLEEFLPDHLLLLNSTEKLNTMNPGADEPSSGLNGRLRPRKSNIPSPQTTKSLRRSRGKSGHDKVKRTSTLSKTPPNIQDDLATKSDTTFLCPYCDRKFASKQSLSKHIRRIHGSSSKQDNSFGCLFCSHSAAESSDIVRHMGDLHPEQYFACLNCHARFPAPSELAEHKIKTCELRLPYRSKLRKKVSSGTFKDTQKSAIDGKNKFGNESNIFSDTHGFNGVVISCELKPSQVNDGADIEDNITTNLILPPSKHLGSNTVVEKNAVIVLDDIQWNKRIPPNFSFHNTDADQILSRLGVVHRSPRTGEPSKKDWKSIDDSTQKFEKCFDTSFYSKVASNVHENISKFLDGSFNFNPDPDSTIKTRKSKNSVLINTAEGFPILLASDQYSRNEFDRYMPRAVAPKHKWKWDNLETEKSPINPDQIKRDSHTNNCIITLVSSLDIWTQLRMRRKFEEKFGCPPLEKKTEKQTIISNELKDILESRELPASSSPVVKVVNKGRASISGTEFPAWLGLTPSTPAREPPPAVLSGEWVRPRCYVCCACGAQNQDSRAACAHATTQHPNAQVQHYEIVGEQLLNADILKHLYVPPSQMSNRTRPLRGIRECTKCKKSITLEDLHQHMLDCAGDTPAVRRKCRSRPFGVRRRRTRLPDNTIRKKIRKGIRTRQTRPKTLMRPRPIRTEVGDAETIRKMIADLPAKRHRVLVNPNNPSLRPRIKQRPKLLIKGLSSQDRNKRKNRNNKETAETRSASPTNDDTSSKSDEDKPLKPKIKRLVRKTARSIETDKTTIKRLNRPKRKNTQVKELQKKDDMKETLNPNCSSKGVMTDMSVENSPKKIDIQAADFKAREHVGRGNSSNRDGQRPSCSGENANSQNRCAPVQNVPLKHSIARLTADSEKQDKSVQFHHLFLVQQECNNVNQHVNSGQQLLFENEAAVLTLDKPPLHCNSNAPLDACSSQKNKLNKPRKGLNACIAMLKNKLVETPATSASIPTGHVSVQCGDDEPLYIKKDNTPAAPVCLEPSVEIGKREMVSNKKTAPEPKRRRAANQEKKHVNVDADNKVKPSKSSYQVVIPKQKSQNVVAKRESNRRRLLVNEAKAKATVMTSQCDLITQREVTELVPSMPDPPNNIPIAEEVSLHTGINEQNDKTKTSELQPNEVCTASKDNDHVQSTESQQSNQHLSKPQSFTVPEKEVLGGHTISPPTLTEVNESLKQGQSNDYYDSCLNLQQQTDFQLECEYNRKMLSENYPGTDLNQMPVNIRPAHASTNVESIVSIPLDLSGKASMSNLQEFPNHEIAFSLRNSYDTYETLDLSNKNQDLYRQENLSISNEIVDLSIKTSHSKSSEVGAIVRDVVTDLSLTSVNNDVPTDLTVKKISKKIFNKESETKTEVTDKTAVSKVTRNLDMQVQGRAQPDIGYTTLTTLSENDSKTHSINLTSGAVENQSAEKLLRNESAGSLQLVAPPVKVIEKAVENIPADLRKEPKSTDRVPEYISSDLPSTISQVPESASNNLRELKGNQEQTSQSLHLRTCEKSLPIPKPIYDPTLKIPQYKIRAVPANDAPANTDIALNTSTSLVNSTPSSTCAIVSNNTAAASILPQNVLATNLSGIPSIGIQEQSFGYVQPSAPNSNAGSMFSITNTGRPSQLGKFESTTAVYTLANACISVTKIETSNSTTLTNTLLSIPGTTIANTTPVYTLAGTTIGIPAQYTHVIPESPSSDKGVKDTVDRISVENHGESPIESNCGQNSDMKKERNVSKEFTKDTNMSFNMDHDPETARKIALLPKELVDILGNMPVDHRNQLLNVLPQYVSTATPVPDLQSGLTNNSELPEKIKTSPSIEQLETVVPNIGNSMQEPEANNKPSHYSEEQDNHLRTLKSVALIHSENTSSSSSVQPSTLEIQTPTILNDDAKKQEPIIAMHLRDAKEESQVEGVKVKPDVMTEESFGTLSLNILPMCHDYSTNRVIDLTEDESMPRAEIRNEPSIEVSTHISVLVQKPKRNKTNNDQTASLRAVRIKAPSERQRSVDNQLVKQSTLTPVLTNKLDNDQDNEAKKSLHVSLNTDVSLAIQQAEVSSTQHTNKNVISECKFPSAISPNVQESNGEEINNSLTLISTASKDEMLKNDDMQNIPLKSVAKSTLVTSSFVNNVSKKSTKAIDNTSDLLNSDFATVKYISKNLVIPSESGDINKEGSSVLTESRIENVLDISESYEIDAPIRCSTPNAKPFLDSQNEIALNPINHSWSNSCEEQEDSDDNLSLAVICKQKQQKLHKDPVQNQNTSQKKSNTVRKRVKKNKKKMEEENQKIVSLGEESCCNNNTLIPIISHKNDEQTSVTDLSDVPLKFTDDDVQSKSFDQSEKVSKMRNTIVIINKALNANESVSNLALEECGLYDKTKTSEISAIVEAGVVEIGRPDDKASALKDEQKIIDSTRRSFRGNDNTDKANVSNQYPNDEKLSKSIPLRQKTKKKKKPIYDVPLLECNKSKKSIMDIETKGVVIEETKLDLPEIVIGQTLTTTESLNSRDSCVVKNSTNDLRDPNSIDLIDVSISTCSRPQEPENRNSPLRRSRRRKSLSNSVGDDEILHTETSPESKTPLTKKQLIFSKLLLDEENNLKAPESVPENKISIAPSAPQNETKFLENPIMGKNKSSKRKKSPHLKRKYKKKKLENDSITCEEDMSELPLSPTKPIEDTSHVDDNHSRSFEHSSDQTVCEVSGFKSANLMTADTESSLEKDKGLIISIEKRKSSELTSAESLHSPQSKKTKLNKTGNKSPSISQLNEVESNAQLESDLKTIKQNINEKETSDCNPLQKPSPVEKSDFGSISKNKVSKENELRVKTCYNMPVVAGRRTRSKSAVIQSAVYDPYDIDMDDMIEHAEPLRQRKISAEQKPSCTTKHHTSEEARDFALEEKEKEITSHDNGKKDSNIKFIIRNYSTDSDDSSKSDIPLNKYVEEKEKKNCEILGSRSSYKKDVHFDPSTEVSSTENQNSLNEKRNKSTNEVSNSDEGVTPDQTEEQLRSEQFMESFGFFSERKPRKSNLLATKKISETFHIIANECDDMYFGFKERIPKKSVLNENRKSIDEDNNVKGPRQRSPLGKKSAKRGRKKKTSTVTTPRYCDICKKEFRRPDNFVRHQMTLLHVSKVSEVEMKVKTVPVHEEPNYLLAYKEHLDRIKAITDKITKRKKNSKSGPKVTPLSLEEVLADVNKIVREQQLSLRGLSCDEELFLDCCELLKESHKKPEPVADTPSLAKNNDSVTVSPQSRNIGLDLLGKSGVDIKCDNKNDGDVDSITAKSILESEEVRNLENDLISGLKEAANASNQNSNIVYQRTVNDEDTDQHQEFSDHFSSPAATESHYDQLDNYEEPEELNIGKTKKYPEFKEKMYPDIEEIDMFEDKFDKIKRKCRSQAAAAKQTQHVVEPNTSRKGRKKSDKKKGKKGSKKIHSSTVLTKGALKGFDGIKVSIPTSDINIAAIVSPLGTTHKKRKKGSSKKRRENKISESSSKYDSDHPANDSSASMKNVDVYEFMDNEDVELFEFRPSTLMERFKSISNKETPSTSKVVNPVVEEAENSSTSASDGDDFVYMSDDYVCSDDETENSLMSCDASNTKVVSDTKKPITHLKRRDVVEKNAVMGKIFKNNAVRSEKKMIKSKEPQKPKANLDQLFDSLLEDEPSSSMLNDESLPLKDEVKLVRTSATSSPNQSVPLLSKYEQQFNLKKNEQSLASKENYASLKQNALSSDNEDESSCLTDYGPSTSKISMKTLIGVHKSIRHRKRHSSSPVSTNKFDVSMDKLQHSASKKLEKTSLLSDHFLEYQTGTSKMDAGLKVNDSQSFENRSPIMKLDDDTGISCDYNESYDQISTADETGVARQRARRKCTVGKQNILAETWSSESEPDGGPPRSHSAESLASGTTRKKKGKKKDVHQSSSRRGSRHISFRKQDIESRVSSSNRNTTTQASPAGSSTVMESRSAGSTDALAAKMNEASTSASKADGDVSEPATTSASGAVGAVGAVGAAGASAASSETAATFLVPAEPAEAAACGKGRFHTVFYWSPEGHEQQQQQQQQHQLQQQHGWIVGDSHKKLVTMLAHAKGRKRNNDDKRHLVE